MSKTFWPDAPLFLIAHLGLPVLVIVLLVPLAWTGIVPLWIVAAGILFGLSLGLSRYLQQRFSLARIKDGWEVRGPSENEAGRLRLELRECEVLMDSINAQPFLRVYPSADDGASIGIALRETAFRSGTIEAVYEEVVRLKSGE